MSVGEDLPQPRQEGMVFDHITEEFLFAGEVVVHESLRDAGGFSNVLDGGPFESAVGEDL